ncbi:MAG: gamma-glutamylcyclotransferase [Methylobacter tundripaludum]|nr:gamma-glutamylcyclotransferase [Methylobacter tundripaludum]
MRWFPISRLGASKAKLQLREMGSWSFQTEFPSLSLGTSEDRRIMNLDYIFVYGTLRRDTNSEMSHLLAKHAEFVGDAAYQGRLYKVDCYPGAVPSDDPNDVVQGEVYLLHQADVALPLLDQYEEFGPEFPEPNEYSRQKQSVLLKSGRFVTVWVYVYNHPTEGLELVESANFIQQSL